METLAQRHCIPCRGGVPPLTHAELEPLLAQLDSEWGVLDAPSERHGTVMKLVRDYKFKNFREALDFTIRVGETAEEQQHHPDVYLAWGKARIEIWTHKIGGLTESDAIFAAKCDAMYS